MAVVPAGQHPQTTYIPHARPGVENGGSRRVRQGSTGTAPLPLDSTPTQSVPNSSSLYTLFYSVIYNSVGGGQWLASWTKIAASQIRIPTSWQIMYWAVIFHIQRPLQLEKLNIIKAQRCLIYLLVANLSLKFLIISKHPILVARVEGNTKNLNLTLQQNVDTNCQMLCCLVCIFKPRL